MNPKPLTLNPKPQEACLRLLAQQVEDTLLALGLENDENRDRLQERVPCFGVLGFWGFRVWGF